MNNNMEKEIFEIYIDDIIPNRFQPRLAFDEASLNELATSIKQHGIIQPLVVREVGDKYEIIAGERRYKAAQIAGLKKVPAVIMNLDDSESAEVAVVENIQRRDLTALEEAESYKKLLDRGYLTQEQLANRMGKTQATVSNKLRLLGLQDEVKEALLNQKISERHARSLLSLRKPEDQIGALHKIIDNKLTVKQTDDLIKTMVSPSEIVPSEQLETIDLMNNSLPTEVKAEEQPSAPIVEEPAPNENPPIMTVPVTEIVPQVLPEDNQPVASVPEIPVPSFEPVSNIDVEKIKEQAQDINPAKGLADIDALLGKTGEVKMEEPEQQPLKAIESTRFIPFFNDEEGQPEQQLEAPVQTVIEEPTIPFNDAVSAPMEPLNNALPASEPQTYTDSLVNEFRQSNPQPVTVENNQTSPTNNLRSAINSIRETTTMLEKNGFKVDSEEFDFENVYQIIIKINK